MPLYPLFDDPLHQFILVDNFRQLVFPSAISGSSIPKPKKKEKGNEGVKPEKVANELTLTKPCQIRLNILILMHANIERTSEPKIILRSLRTIKQLLTAEDDAIQQRQNSQFVIEECSDLISILCLMLLVSDSFDERGSLSFETTQALLADLKSEAITILLALSFC